MKKFLLIAVAAMGLLFTACSKDEVAQPVGGEESVVTFTVEAPVMQTRAEHGDGTLAKNLTYAVYNRADGTMLFDGTATMNDELKTTVKIPFVNGMTYDILFWAESPASPYEVDWDAKTVGYKDANALVSNSMDYDAFYYFLTGNELPEITGPVTKTVELKRPFAQLNIITNDAKEAKQSGVEVKEVKVVVKNGYSSFDLAAGEGETKGEVTFGFAAKQENADAEGVQLLAVDYLFTGGVKSLVDVEFTYTDVNGKVAAAGEVMEFAAVPVQRNYRTNIVGSLLTSDGKFNIEIKPGFDGTNDHSVATATPEDVNALIQNPEVTTVELGAGVYEIELYNLAEKKTLTINGTEGTQIKFKNQQVRACQFDELVINNCEILRMATKSWGHLVFGSSDNANGVYTISNCTFNGVGTQGIYINEDTSGVTYNILNCTFNGNFGNEGAITIQANPNVNHIVNVKGCTFNNIPDTSHKIFLASWDGQGSFYYDWTLNTDLKAANIDEVNSLIKCGAKTINLADGNYNLSKLNILPNKAITLVGENKDNCVVTIADQLRADGKSLTLKNLTTTIPVGLNYTEQTFAWIHFFKEFNMVDCKSDGRIRLNCYSANIDNCEFNVTTSSGFDGYAIYYYGPTNSKVVVSNSTFNTVGKAIVMYNEGAPVLDMTVNNCTFLSSQTTDKAAIQMHTEWGISGKLTINNSTATGFAAINNGLYNELNNNTKTPTHKFNITVDGKVASTLALKAALAVGETNIELMPATYDAGQFQVVNKTLSLKGIGDGAKIFISQNNDVAYTTFDMCNVTFENLTIETLGGNYKGFARMNGIYKNCTIVNNYFTCYGKHEFTGCTFNAPNDEHCMWTYGAEEVDFVNCEFNYSDRGVNVYVDNYANAPGITSDVAFTNCVFNTTNTSSEGAVEINSSPFTAGVTVALTGCTAPAYGEMVYISRWDGTHGATATVTVDGVAL